MKQILLISFDFLRDGEPKISYSVGSLLSYLKSHKLYQNKFNVEHISFNIQVLPINNIDKIVDFILLKHQIDKFHAIAISCYVWSHTVINPLIKALRRSGFVGKIILGGNQIAYQENIKNDYPDCQFFLYGYAEESLLDAILLDSESIHLISKQPNFKSLPSPYLDKTIFIKKNQKKIRLETKRGCNSNCGFCAHIDLQNHKTHSLLLERIFNELLFCKKMNVGKINFVDPTFNIGPDYLKILRYCSDINLKATLALQTRIEQICKEKGEEFLQLCKSLNVILEFGVQTIHENELNILGRKTNIKIIQEKLNRINHMAILNEASLIFGIPSQTIKSFNESISFLRSNGCKTIKAYGLMLLKGTEIWKNRKDIECVETEEGEYKMPYITKSNSFSRQDWEEMKRIADSLNVIFN